MAVTWESYCLPGPTIRRGGWIDFDQPFFWDAQKSKRVSRGPTIVGRLREEKEAAMWGVGTVSSEPAPAECVVELPGLITIVGWTAAHPFHKACACLLLNLSITVLAARELILLTPKMKTKTEMIL